MLNIKWKDEKLEKMIARQLIGASRYDKRVDAYERNKR